MAAGLDHIVIKGAREHNLKNIDLALPRNRLIVVTGLSGRGNRRSRSIRFTPKGSAATSSRSRRTRGSFWDRWRSPTSITSRGFRRRFRSIRSRPRAIRARRSVPSPRSTTTCACSSRASARRIATTAVARSARNRASRSSTRLWSCPKARASSCSRRWFAAARASTPSCSRKSPKRASRACASTARSKNCARRSCSIRSASTRSKSSSTAS